MHTTATEAKKRKKETYYDETAKKFWSIVVEEGATEKEGKAAADLIRSWLAPELHRQTIRTYATTKYIYEEKENLFSVEGYEGSSLARWLLAASRLRCCAE